MATTTRACLVGMAVKKISKVFSFFVAKYLNSPTHNLNETNIHLYINTYMCFLTQINKH